jgi:hypothetical protein
MSCDEALYMLVGRREEQEKSGKEKGKIPQ